jgi:hypothetical protein
MSDVRTRAATGLLGWLAVATLATAGSVAAVTAIGTSITGTAVAPLSPAEVDRALASSGPTPATTLPASAPPGGTTRSLPTEGGSVLASCAGGKVTLRSWSPAQGFRTDHIEPGPGDKATLKFESEDKEIEVTVSCADGVPTIRTNSDD